MTILQFISTYAPIAFAIARLAYALYSGNFLAAIAYFILLLSSLR